MSIFKYYIKINIGFNINHQQQEQKQEQMLKIIGVSKNNLLNKFLFAGLNVYNYKNQMYLSSFKLVNLFSQEKKSRNKLLNTYQKIKQSQLYKRQENKQIQLHDQQQKQSSSQVVSDVIQKQQEQSNKNKNNLSKKQKSFANVIPYTQKYKINCQGCNVILQSKDNTKYGYINEKVLKQAIEQNIKKINKGYGQKIKSKDAKILDFMHQVQKQSGIKIFNQQTNKLENMDNIEVLMRMEQKIQKYQKQQQLAHRYSKQRKEVLCFRCFSLKYHNRLPQQYDTNEGFTTDSTQFILNKLFNRHKDKVGPQTVQYLYIVDAFDIIGTFQQWLFKRLIQNNLDVKLVVNKIDVINKQYINETALHAAINKKLKTILKPFCKNQEQFKEKFQKIKVFYISCNSRDGMKKLKQHLQASSNHIQLIGFPNTGKTTLLNILSKIKKSTSKVPGTTIKITEHNYHKSSKRKVYDMPGLYSKNLLYNLITKPSIKTLLTWHKRIAPGLLTNSVFIYGGKIQIPDTRIIIFGQGGACQSSNKWFIDNYKQFWKGLPEPSLLKIKKYQFNLEFVDGKADDLQIAGYGFVGFRLSIPNVKKAVRKLTLYLPQNIQFGFRNSILSVNDSAFHRKSALTKKFMLERLTIFKGKSQKKQTKKSKEKKETRQTENDQNDNENKNQNQDKSNDDVENNQKEAQKNQNASKNQQVSKGLQKNQSKF